MTVKNSFDKPVKLLPNNEEPDEWKQFMPILYWLPKYNVHKALFEDVITGLTLGIMRYLFIFCRLNRT